MLKIKLSRIGKKNKPMYRLIISEQAKDPYGNSLEILGSYNPHSKELQVKQDRIKYWISQGAQMTPTINNLLVGQKIIEGDKVKASKAKKKKKETEESAKPKTEAPVAEPDKEKKDEKTEESAKPKAEAPKEEEKKEIPATEPEEKKEEAKTEESA